MSAATEIGSGVRVTMLPDDIIKSLLTDGALWRELGYRILARSQEICPVGRDGSGNPTEGSGSLKESLVVRFQYGLDARIEIGSTLTRGDQGYSALDLVEEKTQAHEIPGNPVLAFVWKGEQVFFANVNHPGTKANPFIEKAMQQIVRESGGAAFKA